MRSLLAVIFFLNLYTVNAGAAPLGSERGIREGNVVYSCQTQRPCQQPLTVTALDTTFSWTTGYSYLMVYTSPTDQYHNPFFATDLATSQRECRSMCADSAPPHGGGGSQWDWCQTHPAATSCRAGYCGSHPQDPACRDSSYCTFHPTDPQCRIGG